MWLSLIPQIHSPGDSPDLSMRHHHFIEENPQFYDGKRDAVDRQLGNLTRNIPLYRQNSLTDFGTSKRQNQCTIDNGFTQAKD